MLPSPIPLLTPCRPSPILATLLVYSLVPSTTWQQPLICLLALDLQFPVVFPTDFAFAGRKSMGKLQGRLQVAWVSISLSCTPFPSLPTFMLASHIFMDPPDPCNILVHLSNLCCTLVTLLRLLRSLQETLAITTKFKLLVSPMNCGILTGNLERTITFPALPCGKPPQLFKKFYSRGVMCPRF